VPAASDAIGWWSDPLPNTYLNQSYASGSGFFFSPPIAIAFYPFTLLPWPVFAAFWTGIMLTALGLLGGRYSAVLLLIPIVWWEISASNIALLIGLAAVVGFRWPVAWSFVLLTKVTPGVGLIWFLVRREWRNLAIAIVATAAIAGLSFAVAPDLWWQWFQLLAASAGESGPGYFTVPVPLPIRLALAIAIVAWGGLTNRRWTVVVAVVLGAPVLWLNASAALVAVIALLSDPRWSGNSALWRIAQQPTESRAT